MAQTTLVDRQIDDGQKLVDRLSREAFGVTAAGWVKESEEGQWFLYIASPAVDREGPAAAYRRVHTAIGQMSPPFWVDRFEVKVIGASNPIARDVLKARGGASGPSPAHHGGGRLGDLPIEEAYLYPAPPAARSAS